MIKHFDMELTTRMLDEYNLATKEEKGRLIDEYAKRTGVKRNTAVARFTRSLKRPSKRKLKKKGRKQVVFASHKLLLRKCWDLSGCICGERLHPMLSDCLDSLSENDKLKYFDKEAVKRVKMLSAATLKRIISTFPKPTTKKKKGSKSIYQEVPIKAHFGQYTDKVGNTEVDFVEHNGGTSAGKYAITGCYTDLYSQWTVRASGLGKNQSTVDSIHKIVSGRIYHKIIEYHPDNFDQVILTLLQRRLGLNGKPNYFLSRSRPYKKNDNAHVEQKNFDKVRNLSGYLRYDTLEEVSLLNQLYAVEDLLSNFFTPSQKLVEKLKNKHGRVIGKIHDKATSPYKRLMEAEDVSPSVKQKLTGIRTSLNLVNLRQMSNSLKKKLTRFNDKKYELTTRQNIGFDDI